MEKLKELHNKLSPYLTAPGSIYYVHFRVLKFGCPDSPWHFTVVFFQKDKKVFTHPCTSKRGSTESGFWPLNIKEILRNQQTNKYVTGYIVFRFSCAIDFKSLQQETFCMYKGHLPDDIIRELWNAKRRYIKSHHKRKTSNG